jgi:hypothetical protein
MPPRSDRRSGIKLPENLDELIQQERARKLMVDRTGGAEHYKSVWTVDVKVVTTYTEHRYPFTAGEAVPPPRVEYGDKLKGLTIVLSMEGIVALQRISDFFCWNAVLRFWERRARKSSAGKNCGVCCSTLKKSSCNLLSSVLSLL